MKTTLALFLFFSAIESLGQSSLAKMGLGYHRSWFYNDFDRTLSVFYQ